MAKAKSNDPVTGNWSSPDGLWYNVNDADGSKVGDTITLTITSGKTRYKSYIGVCIRDDNKSSSRKQDYSFYGDKNRNGIVDKKDKLLGELWVYTYGFIASPIKSGTFSKVLYNGPLYISLGSNDALQYTDNTQGAGPPGPVGYGGSLGPNYF